LTTIDVPTRQDMTAELFDFMSFEDALKEADQVEPWLVEGIISSGSTLIYGQAKVGKSFLVSALIASLMSGEDYLGRPAPQDRDFSVALCWCDDGDRATYARQIREVLPDGSAAQVGFYTMPPMTADRWDALYDLVIAKRHSLVVIDNLTQAMEGNINSQEDVGRFFHGVRRFTRAGIPVVIIGHSSDKVGQNGYAPDKPMGSSAIRGSVRWLCYVKRSNKGNLTLTFTGNHAEPHKIIIKHGAGARFEVLSSADADQMGAEAENRKRQRDAATLDKNKQMAEWVVANCQGMSQRQTAEKLAAQFGGSASSLQSSLSVRALSKLLVQTPMADGWAKGQGSSWALADRD
jgi:hypothetical protein